MPDQAGHLFRMALPLGRYGGIPIYVHWSVLLMAVLQTEVLAVWVLPDVDPDHATWLYWVVAAGVSLIIFGTLLAHPLAHAVAARRYGGRVSRVTVWILGGLTEVDGEPPSPRADALVAIAGPVASLLLAASFGAGWAASDGLVRTSLGWVAAVNVLFGVFNLLPGAPADGGWLLRSVLWARYRDRTRATAASARAGRAVGMLLLIGGLVGLLTGELIGVWLAVGGAFVLAGAAPPQLS